MRPSSEFVDASGMERFWPEWDGLLERAHHPDPLRRSSWLRVWLELVGVDANPIVVGVRRGGELVAGAVLVASRRRGLRVLRQIGDSGDLAQPEFPSVDGAARAALSHALRGLRGDLLVLEGLDDAGVTVRGFRHAGLTVRLEDTQVRRRLVMADRQKRLRERGKRVRKLIRILGRAERESSTFVSSEPSEVVARLPALLDFQAEHWDGDPSANQLAGPGVRRLFSERALVALAREGRLWNAEFIVDGRLAAFQLVAIGERSALLYNSAYDRSDRQLSGAGWASMLAAADAVAEAGIPQLDTGPGDLDYKRAFSEPILSSTAYVPISPLGHAAMRLRDIRTLVRGHGRSADALRS